jgi:hypothetical protein
VLLASLCLAPVSVQAQATMRLSGQVLRVGLDTAPAAGSWVVLHRVGRDRQGPLDSVRTGSDGRFSFTYPADTTGLHIITAGHAGIQYFSPPLSTNPDVPNPPLTLVVNDTSSSAPVETTSRFIVVSAPEADGFRTVVELLTFTNQSSFTRVAPDSVTAAWSFGVPASAERFVAEPGELSHEAIVLGPASVSIFAPLAPGDRQLTLRYAVPRTEGTVTWPFTQRASGVELLVEEDGATVGAPSLEQVDSTIIDGRRFRRWAGTMAAGDSIVLEVPAPLRLGGGVLPALVGVTALAMTWALWRALRSRGQMESPRREGPEALVDRIARLDEANRDTAPGTPEADAYQHERAQLKSALARLLAERRSPH